MKIQVKFFASLRDYLANPADCEFSLEVLDTATPGDILEQLSIPSDKVHLVLINGVYVPPETRDSAPLSSNDVVAFWPPIAGGQPPPR